MEVGVGEKGAKKFEVQKEEHCSVVLWPGEDYAGHCVPDEGTGSSLVFGCTLSPLKRKINLNNLSVLITDGCAKMVGWKTGAHATFEKIMKKPLQRVICFFHHLEKSFEKIFLLYDGPTASPDSLSGPIRQIIKGDSHKKPVVNFVVLPNISVLSIIDAMPEQVFKDLNTDHQLFIKLVRVIITGVTENRWVEMRAGPLFHALVSFF